MKLRMSRTLKQIRSGEERDRGFAMPITIGFGLVILMIAGTMMLRSQSDTVTAAAQKATGGSLNITEGGVTRMQSFLNTNRAMATFSLNEWLSASTSMPNLTPCSSMTPAQVTAFANVVTTWQNLDPSDASKGQYRLVNYTYTPNNTTVPHSTPGTGVLEVEGRLGTMQSTNRLRVSFPVNPGDVIGVPIPGVWVADGGTGNNRINGNVLLNDCNISPGSVPVTGADPTTGEPYISQHTTMLFPDLPPQPSPVRNTLPSNINSDTLLPRSGDNFVNRTINGQTVRLYEYVVNSLDIAQNSALTILPGIRVTFYLNGSIRRGGDIRHDCSTAPAGIPCRPTDFQIFGYGPQGSSICLNGVGFIDAFILAPNYYVGVAGSGGGQGGIRGAVWTNNWSNSGGCGSNTSNVVVTQTGNWDFLGLTPRNLPPKLAPVSSWTRQELP